jgi:hypothetical protein
MSCRRNSVFKVLGVISFNPKLQTVKQNPILVKGFLNVPVLADPLATLCSLKTNYDFLASHMVCLSAPAPQLYAHKNVGLAKIRFEARLSDNQSQDLVTIAGYMQGAFIPRLFPFSLCHETLILVRFDSKHRKYCFNTER